MKYYEIKQNKEDDRHRNIFFRLVAPDRTESDEFF